MKIFSSSGLIMVPREWLTALGEPRHHQQGHLLVVAPDKATAQRMLTARSTPGQAYHLVQAIRLKRGQLATPEQALFDAGIIHPGIGGVFAWYEAIKDHPVVQPLPGGRCPVVGYFRINEDRGPGNRIYAERARGDRRAD